MRKPIKRSYYRTGGVARIQRKTYGKDWFTICREVKERDNHQCQGILSNGTKCCSRTSLEVHHIIPLSRGGTNSKLNLITLCLECHERRHKHMRG